MQASGVFRLKDRVLAENTTLHEPYKSVVVELVGPLTLLIEEPRFIDDLLDGDGMVGIIGQITPSGTIDLKIFPTTNLVQDADKVEARQAEKDKEDLERKKKQREDDRKKREEKAKEDLEANARARAQTKLLAEQEKNKNEKAKLTETGVNNAPEPTLEQLEEAKKEIEKENSENSKRNEAKGELGTLSPIKALRTNSGKLVQNEKTKDEKTSTTNKRRTGKFRRVKR